MKLAAPFLARGDGLPQALILLLGGLAFDVPDARLHAAGAVTVASGVGLLAVELAKTGVFLYTGAGVASILKLALLALGLAFPVARQTIAYATGHLGLLRCPKVYAALRAALEGRS